MSKRAQRPIEEINIVLIRENLVAEAEEFVAACEHCANNAFVALDYVLDALTGCDPQVTEYMMCRPARCPACSNPVHEKTLIKV